MPAGSWRSASRPLPAHAAHGRCRCGCSDEPRDLARDHRRAGLRLDRLALAAAGHADRVGDDERRRAWPRCHRPAAGPTMSAARRPRRSRMRARSCFWRMTRCSPSACANERSQRWYDECLAVHRRRTHPVTKLTLTPILALEIAGNATLTARSRGGSAAPSPTITRPAGGRAAAFLRKSILTRV